MTTESQNTEDLMCYVCKYDKNDLNLNATTEREECKRVGKILPCMSKQDVLEAQLINAPPFANISEPAVAEARRKVSPISGPGFGTKELGFACFRKAGTWNERKSYIYSQNAIHYFQ